MVEGGARLSSRVSTAAAPKVSDRRVPAALWGRVIRTVLFSPRHGFGRALELGKTGGGWPRVALFSLPAALAGAFSLLIFLKFRGLIGYKEISSDLFRWDSFTGALAGAALTGVLAHLLFGVLARPLLARLGRRRPARDLWMIWALAGVPAALGLVLLLPLDILISGEQAYAALSGDTLVTAWAAGSSALALGAAGWSMYLFARGLAVAAEIPLRRSIMVVVLAAFCFAVAAPLGVLLVIGVVELVGLLVQIVRAVGN